MSHRNSRASFALAFGLLAVLAAPALAGPSRQGPQMGRNRYTGALVPVGNTLDVDDFVQDLLPGETLSVNVAATAAADGSFALSPLLTLVDPDGIVRSAGITSTEDLRSSHLKNFVVDKPGRWAARVEGRDGTQGGYAIDFKVGERPDFTVKRLRLGNDLPFSRTHTFTAFEGALLNAEIKYSNRGLPVEFRALEDPTGNDVVIQTPERLAPVEAVTFARSKGNHVFLDNIPLTKGDGTYVMRVRVPTAEGKYDLRIRVTPPVRPKSRKAGVLTDLEPLLDFRDNPIGAEVGDTITFHGANFSTDTPPTVLFAKSASTSVTVSPDGTTLQVVVPPQSGPTLAAVFIVNSDGQVACRDKYFAYVPPPEITDVVDAVTALPVRAGSTDGGRQLRLVGKNLIAGQTLTLGATQAAALVVTSTTTANFTLPAAPPGTVTLTVTDEFARTATSDFTFLYKTPPKFAAKPYNPSSIKLNTATLLTITGTGFAADDIVLFNGVPIPSTFVSSTIRTILLGGLGVGTYPVRIVDSIGTVVDGPGVDVKFPPSITIVTVTAGAVLAPSDIPIYGGSTVRVDGANFLTSDTVTIAGIPVTTFVTRTATSFSFLAPANLAGGFATVAVTDGAGQVASVTNAVRYSGFASSTATRMPSGTSADDYGAGAIAAADLDADGRNDDVVIVSGSVDGAPGTQTRRTRLLFGNNSTGRLEDKTNTTMPSGGTDVTRTDFYDATCVAIGDLDKVNGNDIVIGGVAGSGSGPYPEVRLLKNGGTGVFTLDQTGSAPSRYQPATYAYYNGIPNYKYTVYRASAPKGTPVAIALGDIDKDGDSDVVVGFDHYDSRYAQIDPKAVYTHANGLPAFNYYTISTPGYFYVNAFYYSPAVRVYRNNLSTSAKNLVDISATVLPSAGNSKKGNTPVAALNCRDLLLGDIDKDGDLDMIVAWDDPRSVTALGLSQATYSGGSSQAARLATQVLLNNGTGSFTNNATTTWIPAGSGVEFFQASRIRLGDLDNDGDLDLVMVLKRGLDAYAGTETHTRQCLRVLRNDGTRFTNVSASAIPAVDTVNGDDWRGESLTLADVNGDSYLDIIVGTTEALKIAGVNARSTRLFTGAINLRFTRNDAFQPDASVDTGEALAQVVVPDLGTVGLSPLVSVTEKKPATSVNGERLRSVDWKK